MANDLFYYLKQVQRRAGLTVSSAFPSSPTDEQQLVLDCINETLRYLNNKHYLLFKQTEYTLTTTAGQRLYNLANAPYSQTFWRVTRLARNAVRRAADDFPLSFLDYTEVDALRPVSSSNGTPRYYSAFGEDLILHPPADGSQVKVRYYGLHIGTDSTGLTKKLKLTASGDLTMLDDCWEDALVAGAHKRVRGQQKVDEKFKQAAQDWENWENILKDMGNQPGEEAGPAFVVQPYVYSPESHSRRFYPFFTDNPGA